MSEPRVLVLGNHPATSWSMRLYSELLRDAYREAGLDVMLASPDARASRAMPVRRLKPLVVHLENLVVFPLAQIARARRAEVLHVADHGNGAWLLWPHLRGKTIVTAHDMLAIRGARGEFPEHQADLSERLRQRLIVRGLRRADALHCVSQATADDVRAEFPDARLEVVLNPLRGSFGADGAGVPRDTSADIPADAPAVLVSGIVWRKRRDHAIATWQRLRSEGGLDQMPLHIVGPPLNATERAQLSDAEAAAVRIERDISDAELAALYARARVLIQVSRYEGFGWPIIEAQGQGTVPLCSDTPVFREVGGDGAVFIGDDLDAVAWAEVASRLGSASMREASARNVARFEFGAFARRLARVARSVAGQAASTVERSRTPSTDAKASTAASSDSTDSR